MLFGTFATLTLQILAATRTHGLDMDTIDHLLCQMVDEVPRMRDGFWYCIDEITGEMVELPARDNGEEWGIIPWDLVASGLAWRVERSTKGHIAIIVEA
jgi:hypothetical protein